MNLAPVFAAVLLSLTGAASAQEHQNHAGHGQAAAPAMTQLSIETPIADLIANPAARAVLEKHAPGIDQHPAYEQFKHMSLAQVAPHSAGQITDAMLAAIDAELKALPPS